LIEGETGTGKDLIARATHENSRRAAGPYVEVDCGALAENLVESELFGHVKGAFTGAHDEKPGLLMEAQGGTLFLDEINNLPLAIQTKLLRVLQQRKLRRIGETRERSVDFRLITASSKTLEEMAAEGTFREDLLYRINTITLVLPPLRERRDDILLLAQTFLDKFTALYGKNPMTSSAEALHALTTYAWPGNVRELEHVIERAVILAESDRLGADDFPFTSGPVDPVSESGPLSLEEYVRQAKKRFITRVLQENDGKKVDAAKQLQINRSHLFQLIKQLEIEG
jgi:transcriptional regulator with PAS, ATPase and Fis domain